MVLGAALGLQLMAATPASAQEDAEPTAPAAEEVAPTIPPPPEPDGEASTPMSGEAAEATPPAGVAELSDPSSGAEIPEELSPTPASMRWPSADAPPGATVRPHRDWALGTAGVTAGAALLGVGYLGALVWSAVVFADIPLGVLSCNDEYAGLQLIPVAGPPIAMGVGTSCDRLRAHELGIPLLSTIAQSAGIIVLLIGLAGRNYIAHDGPIPTLAFDPNGAHAGVVGRF